MQIIWNLKTEHYKPAEWEEKTKQINRFLINKVPWEIID